MDHSLTVNFAIPLSDRDWGGPCITFSHWIPNGRAYQIERERDGLLTRVWLDRSCIQSLHDLTDDYVSSWANITVGKVYVEVDTRVSEELARCVVDHDRIVRLKEELERPAAQIDEAYCELGRIVLREALYAYNRLIAYARNYKGQYSLHERLYDEEHVASTSTKFRAQARIDSGDWILWLPRCVDVIRAYIDADSVHIHEDEWAQVGDFIKSDGKPDFVRQLISNALSNLAEGHRRTAIVDIVTALELSLARFSKQPLLDKLHGSRMAERMNRSSLGSRIEHLGLSTTVGFLLPVLFPEHVIPQDVLAKCQEAIEARNNIVHQGQRDLSDDKARPLVAAAIQVCRSLGDFTGG